MLARWRGILGGWRLEESPPLRGLLLADGVQGAGPRRGKPSGVPQGCECGGRSWCILGGWSVCAFGSVQGCAQMCRASDVCKGADICKVCHKLTIFIKTCADVQGFAPTFAEVCGQMCRDVQASTFAKFPICNIFTDVCKCFAYGICSHIEHFGTF